MKLNSRTSLVFLLALFLCQLMQAQGDLIEQEESYDLPAVSLLGEYENLFADLSPTHGGILLNVSGNDMDLAYDRWMDMLGAMEDYSESINYDIRGVKTYMHVFWNPDGTIAHLAFFPKANSRNVPIAELKAFFTGFTQEYQMQITSDTGFNHYASGSFPVFDRPNLSAKKN